MEYKPYQPLFDLLSKEHNLDLTISEMDEIILASQKVVEGMKINPEHINDWAG